MRRIFSQYDSKHYLYQQHVDRRAAEDADQGVSLPGVQDHHAPGRNQLRQTVGRGSKAHILEAVDDQHADECRGQNLAEIGDVGRHPLPE